MDDLGYSDLGYLGGDIPTPNINSLATSGVRLNYHYAENVCSATRSALLTGRYAWKTSLDDIIAPFPPSKQSTNTSLNLISNILTDNGYDTLCVGKWHIGSSSDSKLPHSRGFKQSLYFTQGTNNYHEHGRCTSWEYVISKTNEDIDASIILPLLKDKLPNGLCRYDLWYNNHQSFIEYDDHNYIEDIFADKIMVYLDEYVNNYNYIHNDPFFIYWAMHTPHFPITIPPQTNDECDYLIGKTRQTQCNMLYYADLLIGDIIDDLKDKHLYENTIIMFISDNGAQPSLRRVDPDVLGGTAGQPLPFRGAKSNIFEGGIRTPAFIHLGDMDINCDYNNLVYIADFYPMIANLAGIDTEKGDEHDIDGIDLWRHIETQCNHPNINNVDNDINDIREREEIISFKVSEQENDVFFIDTGYIRTKEYKLLINPNEMSWWDFDKLVNWVNYDGEYYLNPNQTYYESYNEYDSNHYNQKLFYSKCYEQYLDDPVLNNINTEPYLLTNDTGPYLLDNDAEIYLFNIMEDNIESCNIAKDNIEIVDEYIHRLEEKINLYHGSGPGGYLDKLAYVTIIDSYDCDEDTFFFTKWEDSAFNITDDWDTILLSTIDEVDSCSDH